MSYTKTGGKCNICSLEIISKGGNTSNLATHLRRHHKIEVHPVPTVPLSTVTGSTGTVY